MNATFSPHLQWLARQVLPLFRRHLLGISLVMLSSLLFLLDPLLLKWLIDRILPAKDGRMVVLFAVAFVVTYAARLALNAAARLTSFRNVEELVFRIRLNLFKQVNLLSADYHDGTPVGETLYRMEQEVDQIAQLSSTLVTYVLQTAFNAIFVVGAMFVLDFRLAWMLVPLVPLFLILSKYFRRLLQRASASAQEVASKENSFLQEHLASVVQVQLLNQERGQTRIFLDKAITRVKTVIRRAHLEIMSNTCYMAIIAISTSIALGYGSYQVVLGALSVGGLVAFYGYTAKLFEPFQASVDIYSRLNRLRVSTVRILEIINSTPGVPESPDAADFTSPFSGTVEMEYVTFSYGRHPLLKGTNLRIGAGERVALVGASGSGKTTIIKLIARLYDVNHGTVRIDGIDVRHVRLETLRRKVSYLMQDTVLFNRTLKENLLLGKPLASLEELETAVKVADLERLFDRLPNGWDTPLGPRGSAVSSGERQRIALARTVLQSPALLLLDESTSAIDTPSEERIFANLARHFAKNTIVFVSHRVSALTWVDRIIVLNEGAIEAEGTHVQLMTTCALYARLHRASV